MIALFLGILFFIVGFSVVLIFNMLIIIFVLSCVFLVLCKTLLFLRQFPILIRLLSLSPVFNFSMPSNFGEIRRGDVINHSEKIFFSLFSFKFGSIYFLFFTKKIWKENSLFELGKIINLNNIQKLPRYEIINQKYDEYENFLFYKHNHNIRKNMEKELSGYNEMLDMELEENNKTDESITNKINLYTAIVSVIIPLQAAFFKLNNNKVEIATLLLLLCLVYQYLNLFLFFFRFVKIKEYNVLILENHFKKKNSSAEVLLMKYYNSMLQKDKNLFNVTILKNIQKYFRFSLITSVLIYFLIFIK